jgi:hypothetical protein
MKTGAVIWIGNIQAENRTVVAIDHDPIVAANRTE